MMLAHEIGPRGNTVNSVLPGATDTDVRVQFSSRINYAADRQLEALHKQGHVKTELLAEALDLLFKKHGLDEVA